MGRKIGGSILAMPRFRKRRLAKCVPNVPYLFPRNRRPDQQTRSVRTGNDEQADHDQGKSEGGEERALSCSAEDSGETGGESEIWAELRRWK